jgi:RNA polymerase-binding transcription factor DksA
MASAPVLSQAQQQQLLELLHRQRAELCQQWEVSLREVLRDDDLSPPQQRIEDALVELNQALDRIAAGQYGLCQHCAGGIDFERLLAHPAAAFCWPCQELAESKPAPQAAH